MKRRLLFLLSLFGLAGCTGIPQGLDPVRGFDADRYLGTWYEIARLDHSFERGLSNVTAEYAVRKPGRPNDVLHLQRTCRNGCRVGAKSSGWAC